MNFAPWKDLQSTGLPCPVSIFPFLFQHCHLGPEVGCLDSTAQQGQDNGGQKDPSDLAGEGRDVGEQAVTEDVDEETCEDCVLGQV